ncbi:DNA polymerase delta small subunit [Vanrija pseudolonga]|uniref:DNA-directed DNA polymerase n=1 Tax=Vanrija pseudolonga TaxID=143232 RepID=A0AAF0Y7J9_9TREE|nr:DNA polymerase delta small subunit [Vanrija pseudolonga]
MASEISFEPGQPLRRAIAPYSSLPELSAPFLIDSGQRSYKHQYANIYFVRLIELRPVVEERAAQRWKNVRGRPPLLPRVLNLQRGQLCYIVGTIYMDMKLKPSVLEDMSGPAGIAPPPERPKFFSSQDSVHLEDESGRVRLVGDVIRKERMRADGGIVTGCIMAALGLETGNGDFEVVDLCFAGLPDLYRPETNGDVKGKAKASDAMDVDEDSHGTNGTAKEKTWVACVSGLSIGAESTVPDLKAQLLVEWLMGEDGGPQDQLEGARVARVVFAGNSLAAPVKEDRKPKPRFSHTADPAAAAHPSKTLSILISDLLSSSLPVNLVPGPTDPAGALLPQQALPKVMFGGKKAEGLECNTNPGWFQAGDRSFLVTGGQNINDLFKYLPGQSRLRMARRTLELRHVAPTAPDTLWIYPFPDTDPFILRHRPDVYVLGNQPEFETALVGGSAAPTRIILLPSFAETGTVALVCLETLEVKTIAFEVPSWAGDVKAAA